MSTHFTNDERERLEQELLELHFGCHAAPEALQARLRAEPALRELQQQVLRTAELLAAASTPAQPPLALPRPGLRTRPWWRRPLGRVGAAAASAAAALLVAAGWHGVQVAREHGARAAQCRFTVSAPRGVTAGASWSFTAESFDLDGLPKVSTLHWHAIAADGHELAHGEQPVEGSSSVVLPAGLVVPKRLDVTAEYAGGQVARSLEFVPAASAPLVHLTTDRPVYRPGETVNLRAVVLDRATLRPVPAAQSMGARVLDPNGAPVAEFGGMATPAGRPGEGVGIGAWQVPAGSAGGEYTIELVSADGSFPPERLPFVVRSYEAPRLHKTIVLDRKTYAPGAHGSALVEAARLGAGPAAGAVVHASLVLDASEVWSRDGVLDERGQARFSFEVPAAVQRGAARLVAAITDGGVQETLVQPFVVPTGEVRIAAFPEGGELVAGVLNRVYFEASDPLGRPVDTTLQVIDGDDQRIATGSTEHQGRARIEFVPLEGGRYRVLAAGQKQPVDLPAVAARGLALRALGDGIAAGRPLRVQVAGRGDGPWVLGVFCRGLLLAQTTVRPDADGAVDRDVTVELPANAQGVLRLTVFDRAYRPVAERLLRRAATEQLAIELRPRSDGGAPGSAQQIAVTTRDERGRPVPAVVGLSVVDGSALALGDEPRVGLLDQALLFADVERLEDLGDWFVAAEHGERNVDLLLGTRGWRRFVWRNDAAAQAAISKAGPWAEGQLAREGFAQTPQVVSNTADAERAVAATATARAASARLVGNVAMCCAWALGLWVLFELLARVRIPRLPRVTVPLGAAFLLLLTFSLSGPQMQFFSGARPGAAGDLTVYYGDLAGLDFAEEKLAAPLPGATPVRIAGLQPGAGGEDFFVRFGRLQDEDGATGPLLAWRFQGGGGGGDPMALGLWKERKEQLAAGFRFDLAQAAVEGLTRYHRHQAGAERSDFAPTICWQPLLITDAQGEAQVSFDTSDAVTTWHVRADAHGEGRVGQGDVTFATRLPLHVECKLPVEVSAGDQLILPVALEVTGAAADSPADSKVQLEIAVDGPLSLVGDHKRDITLANGRGRELVQVRVGADAGTASLRVVATAGGFRDQLARTFPVVPRGFPAGRSWGGTVAQPAPAHWLIALPPSAVPGSGHLHLRVFPSPLASIGQGLKGLLRQPGGCFEQASSSNYPNVMVLDYLQATGDDVPELSARARELLPQGYRLITGYECREKGYEWFGGDPGHEALTAYGLLEFADMQRVYDVDAGMVARTKAWLLGRRDGKGGYLRNDRALDSFGRAPQAVTDAYVTYALLHTGVPAGELKAEVDSLAARAASTGDAYELALIACALGDAKNAAAATARERLRSLQQKDGSLRGSTTSITSSGGDDLLVETTSFAALAWLGDPANAGALRTAVDCLQTKKSADGTFGATQATICALRALTAFAQQHRALPADGALAVFAGGKKLAEQKFSAGQHEPVDFELWPLLPPGEHELRLELTGGGDEPLPWACDLAYHGDLPADDPDGAIAIATRLSAAKVEEGRTVALEVTAINRRAEGQPMTLAIVGLPAGLDLPTRVLDDRKKAGDFDLWELRGRELVLYWRSLPPKAEKHVQLDLVAAVPGVTTGPASRAYLYYTPAQKRWAPPLRVEVTPTR